MTVVMRFVVFFGILFCGDIEGRRGIYSQPRRVLSFNYFISLCTSCFACVDVVVNAVSRLWASSTVAWCGALVGVDCWLGHEWLHQKGVSLCVLYDRVFVAE